MEREGLKREGEERERTWQSDLLSSVSQECLLFDTERTSLEEAIAGRKIQLMELKTMCSDAQLARDRAKVPCTRK